MELKGDFKYHAVAFLTVAVWGSTFVFTKLLINSGISPAQVFTLRFAIAYALMLALCHGRLFCRNVKDEALMLILGITGGSAYFLTENEALRFSTATNVSLIVCSCPLFTTLLFRLAFRDTRLSAVQAAGTALAFAGMATVVLNGRFVLHLSPAGDALALAACLSWAVYSLVMKPLAKRYGSAFITRKVFFYGLLTMAPYYAANPGFPPPSLLIRPDIMGNLLFLGCVASLVCFLTWTWCIKGLGVVRATNYVYVNPTTTIVFAAWLLGEKITPFFIAGSAMIIIGLYLTNKPAKASA